MRFSHDRRGQSVVIGTVILFGFLIVALAVYQAQIVPQDNAQVEFEHSQSVEGDFVDLRNAVLSAGRSGDDRSTSIPLGTRYPQRTFFVNPPPATGQLSTSDPGGLRIENARVDAEGNVAAYWTDRIDEDDAIAFDTRSIRYAPDYTEFRNPPDLVYEHSFVVAEFDDAALGRTGQTAVDTDRNRIRLTALDGDLRESGVERGSVDPEVLSQNRRSVTLESDDGGPIVLRLPTDVSMDRADDLVTAWERQLGEDVQEVTVAGGEVRIELDGDDSYRLELGKVGVGTGATEPAADDRYITAVPSQRVAAVAEVRDRYNNPVEGVAVDVDVDGSPVETLRTDDDGRVEYVPDGQPTVEMRINEGDEDWEELRFDAGTVGAGGGGGDNINPGENSDVVLNDVGVRGGQRTVDLQFRNNADEDREFREMEFTLYYRSQGDTRESFTVRGPDDTGQELTLRGGFVELDAPFVIPAGGTATFTIEFDANAQNDLLGVSVRDDLNRQALYLAGIEGSIDEEDDDVNGGNGGDDGDAPAEAIFESLSATVTDSGSSGIREVTFDYQLPETASGVDFTVTDDRGETNTETGSGDTGPQTQAVSIDASSGNNRPVTVTADIEGGSCQTATLDEVDSNPLYPDDWEPC
ncbi:hypothetical protein GRS48_03700 [Halorubrum sp. JWXQ-INN 858]|uniref:hypothetical protein n=1 Tax=Halorubrum sp. JWXQ-INN 858 TaxID=2690782 RepID=UPI0013589EC5|nr:hypothetical protein [Halorubrum sp. JWXQ-INN 858]MWV63930.1 hypothetical protein [Halorubrum sp. JWXQ-INN 858]